jgi:hypothetical protein
MVFLAFLRRIRVFEPFLASPVSACRVGPL